MRLLKLKDDGDFSLIEFIDDEIPQYAILSHTWGADDEEVTFNDIVKGTGKSKAGYTKIRFSGKQATKDGLHYFWVDTCCIDKSSSAELSEAINSMFRWYHNAAKCYVYLSDVSIGGSIKNDQFSQQTLQATLQKSRWFTRGWTLQELIAPASVEFFSVEGKRLGDRKSLEQLIHEITGITVQALQGMSLSHFSVDERMSWAARRQTKRGEDAAYSLLGIFDIHMPLIYGEGRKKAVTRLKNKIKKLEGGLCALHQAAKEDQEDAVRQLLEEGADPDSLDSDGCTALFWAARNGHEGVARLLIEKGANPDLGTSDGLTPLWEATYNQHEAVERMLLKKRIDPDSKNQDDRVALFWATYNGDVEKVRSLLENGVNPNSRDRWGAAPLFWAAINGHTAMVSLLLKKGVDRDPRNPDGRTPLWLASHHGRESVVKLLLKNGADPYTRDRWGEAPEYWAAVRGHQTIVRLLVAGKGTSRGFFSRTAKRWMEWMG